MRRGVMPGSLLLMAVCTLPGPIAAAGQPRPVYSDTLRALVVFVRYQDDDSPGDPKVNFRGWPAEDGGRAPAFARTLLSASPTPPFADSSLTDYFHTQSGGNFVIFGDVLDSVLVTQKPEAHYHHPLGGFGDMTDEVLRRLDNAGTDFTRYDYNGDGVLDHLFLIIRSDSRKQDRTIQWTGISCLDARCGGGVAAGGPKTFDEVDGIKVDANVSGSILFNRVPGNIIPNTWLVRLMAHEIGHDLFAPYFVHVPVIQDNDVPATSNRSSGTSSIGYTLMAGSGGGWDCAGSFTMSAFERGLLGWVQCDTLMSTRRGVDIGDLYSTGDCFRIPLRQDGDRSLILTNHQRVGYFDRYRRGGTAGQFEIGLLRTTGLLVTMVDGIRYDVIPSDNTLFLEQTNSSYDGDMYGPATKSQLTPWTIPSSVGTGQSDSRASWIAVDNIRFHPEQPHRMLFDFIDDFRDKPVVRADSRIGPATAGHVFENGMVVVDADLVLDTAIEVRKMLRLEGTATLTIGDEGILALGQHAWLVIGAGARVVVDGRLEHFGSVAAIPGGKITRRNGHIRVSEPGFEGKCTHCGAGS